MPAPSVAAKLRSSGTIAALRRLGLVFLLIVGILGPLWQIHVINRVMPSSHNDLLPRWIGTQAALLGKDPYSPEVTHEIQRQYYGRALTPADDVDPQVFSYPAHLIVLFSPFAGLSWQTACLGFLVSVPPLLAWSLWTCVRFVNPALSMRHTALAVVLSFFSWPVIWGLRLQQPTLLVAIAIFFGLFLLQRDRYIPAGILCALATVKPHLVLLLFCWLAVWAVYRRAWTLLASFVTTLALLLIAAEAMVPGWFGHWRNSLSQYGPQTALPLQEVLGRWPGLLATVMLTAWCGYLLWGLRRLPARSPQFALAAALALSAAVSANLFKLPFIYNQIFTLPGCLALVYSRPAGYLPALTRRIALASLAFGYAVVYVSALGEIVPGFSALWYSLPFRNLLLPVAVTVALGFAAALEIRGRSAQTAAGKPVPELSCA